MRPVIYQLFVRHFANYSTSMKEWGSKEENGCGTFEGITTPILEQIKKMGATHIWLTGVIRHATQTEHPGLPAHPAAIVKGIAGSPYAITNYFDVDPDLAVNIDNRLEEFRALVQRCKESRLVPVIDLIPNHVSRVYDPSNEHHPCFGNQEKEDCFFCSGNSYFYLPADAPGGGAPLKLPVEGYHAEDKVAKVTGNNCISWQPSHYDWYETIKLNYGYDFTKGCQETETLPGDTAAAWQVPRTWWVMDEIIQFWQEMGVVGFRCDMAHMIPMQFWKWALKRARIRYSEAFFIAEAYDDHMKTTSGSPLTALLASGFDYVYDAPSYHLSHQIYDSGKWANDFDDLCNNDDILFHRSVRYLENHDEPRMGSPLHWNGVGKKIAPAISTLLYTLSPGAILFYNGQETGEQADGPGGYGGHDGRSSIYDYTHLPSLSKWLNKGKTTTRHMQDEDLALMTHYQWLLPLLQNPALEKGLFYGLNWFNRHNPDFGRLSGEEVSGHWLRAHLRHDFESRKTVLCLANLNPEWDFPLTRIIIPASAFEWMKWKGEHVYFKEMGSDSPLTDPYTLDELSEDGFSVKIKAGEGMLFEISY